MIGTVSEGTSQKPQSSTPARAASSSNNDNSPSTEVATVSPKELEDRLTKTIEPMLRPGELPKARASIMAVVETTTVQHRGPIPAPHQLREYNAIVPGSADRILSMAEKEQANRHQWEQRHLTFDFATNIFQLSLGFLLSLALAGGAVYLAESSPWVATALVSFSTFGIVATFIKGKRLYGKADHDVPSLPDKSGTAVKGGGKGSRRSNRNKRN
jgi:uncharacterized membrane protein